MSDTPPPPPAPGTPPGTPPQPPTVPAAAVAPRAPGSATTLFWRRRDAATLRGALTTVIIAWVLEIVYQILFVIEDVSWSINDGPAALSSTAGDFFFNGILRALFFFGPTFVALWLFLPIVKESTLPKVIVRAAAASVAGLAGLIVFGLFEAIADTINYSFAFGYFSVTLLWFPIVLALGFAIQTVLGAVVAWLRASKAVPAV
jgi:hypothetical protein